MFIERQWSKISSVVNNDIVIEKSDIFFMKDIGICYFIAELDFTTRDITKSNIDIFLPDLDNIRFSPCENTILVTKNDDIDVNVRIKLSPGKLSLISYPFTPNSKYEMNIQLIIRVINDTFYNNQ
jgi:hypothetical protein